MSERIIEYQSNNWSTRLVVITIFTRDVYVRPHFSNLAKQNEFQVRIVIATGGTMGLAKGIIDDTLDL